MRSTEAVEEVHEGDSGGQSRFQGDQSEVHDFLNGVGAEHGETGLANSHDVRMVAENGKALAGQGAGGDMEDRRGQFAGDLVHVGDHQKKTLGGREGRGQGAGSKGAVDSAGSAAFRLQLGNTWDRAPDVRLIGSGFSVGNFAHRRRRCDRVNGDHFIRGVRHMSGSGIAVHTLFFASHRVPFLICG